MSTVGSLDAIATKVAAVTGMKGAYSVGVADGTNPMPRNVDDGPVTLVMFHGFEQVSGNSEAVLLDVSADVWVPGENAAWANKTLLTFVDLFRTAFRTDMNLGGECTRCSLLGSGDITTETLGERNWIILPFRVEVLIERLAADATA